MQRPLLWCKRLSRSTSRQSRKKYLLWIYFVWNRHCVRRRSTVYSLWDGTCHVNNNPLQMGLALYTRVSVFPMPTLTVGHVYINNPYQYTRNLLENFCSESLRIAGKSCKICSGYYMQSDIICCSSKAHHNEIGNTKLI